jgi:hypothetical protein
MAIILQFPGPSTKIKSPRKTTSTPAIPNVLLEEIAAIAAIAALGWTPGDSDKRTLSRKQVQFVMQVAEGIAEDIEDAELAWQ